MGKSFSKEQIEEALSACSSKEEIYDYLHITENQLRYNLQKYHLQAPKTSPIKQEIGNKYGTLTVIEFDKINDRGEATWKCECECGNIVIRSGIELRRARTFHTCPDCAKKRVSQRRFIDHTGEKHGYLTVIKPAGISAAGNIEWLCKCSCGNECTVQSGYLNYNSPCERLSCGCINSRGEYLIHQILSENNITFKSQVTFDSCRSSKTNALYKFDVGIYNNDTLIMLIEYNGRQHYIVEEDSWNDKDAVQEIQFRDKEKINWCNQYKIPLLIIPYTIASKAQIKDIIFQFLNNIKSSPLV